MNCEVYCSWSFYLFFTTVFSFCIVIIQPVVKLTGLLYCVWEQLCVAVFSRQTGPPRVYSASSFLWRCRCQPLGSIYTSYVALSSQYRWNAVFTVTRYVTMIFLVVSELMEYSRQHFLAMRRDKLSSPNSGVARACGSRGGNYRGVRGFSPGKMGTFKIVGSLSTVWTLFLQTL